MLDIIVFMRDYNAKYSKRRYLNMHSEPWLLAPQLQQERLQNITNLIIQVRGEVIDRHEPEIGDTRLSLGMRAYECCRSRIIYKDTEGDWPWLSILTHEQRFTFAINGVPVRFSRNDPKHLPDRKLIPSPEGYAQMSLFKESNKYSDLRWFLVIDTPYDLPVEHAYFIGYSEYNEIICKWEIPLADIVPVVGEVHEIKPQPVNVPPAKAKLKLINVNEKENDE